MHKKLSYTRIMKLAFLMVSNHICCFPKIINSSELQNSETYFSTEIKKKNINYISPEYILGPGDEIFIDYKGLEDTISGTHLIDPKGFIFLPEIDYFKVADKTVEELKNELENIYQENCTRGKHRIYERCSQSHNFLQRPYLCI